MEKKRIAWIDDDIQSSLLVPYIDEFSDNGVEIIKIKSVEGIVEILKKEAQTLSAILVDIIMPPESLDFGKTRGGLRTGQVVLKLILEEKSLNTIPIVVVTNIDDSKVSDFCKDSKIPCIKKGDYFSDTFVEAILHIIDEKPVLESTK